MITASIARFRSALLKSLPAVRPWGRPEKVIPRVLLLGLSAVVCAGLIALTRMKVFPTNSLWYVFYWVHDVVYLGIKGYTWTLFFPWSLIWYTILAGAVTLIIASFLADRSFLLTPHILVLRQMIYTPGLHTLIFHSTRWMQKAGYSSDLLRATLEQERAQLVLQILAEQQTPRRDQRCNALATITTLLVQIEQLFPGRNDLKLALRWEEAFLTIMLRFNLAEKSEQERFLRIQAKLMPSFFILLSFLGKQKNEWLLGEPANQQMPLGANALLCDLVRLVICSLEAEQKKALQDHFLEEPLATSAPRLLLFTSRAVDQRRFLLEAAVEGMQNAARQLFLTEKVTEGIGDRKRVRSFLRTPAKADPLVLPLPVLAGSQVESYQLSALIAFHLALVDGGYERGVAYFEALDSFAFTLNSLGGQLWKGNSDPKTLRPSVPEDFPAASLSQMVTRFQARMGRAVLKKMEYMLQSPNSILSEQDLVLYHQKAWYYRQSAGPLVSEETSDQKGTI